jgi:phosphatidylethanolamine/phosphatidyl-N-methylethanolamine N-methyltransferase
VFNLWPIGKLCAIKGGVVPTTNALVQRAYDRIARVYDFFFGAILEQGRVRAVRAIRSKPGLRVLELGIGTGLTVPLYSRDWSVAGVDLSPAMLMQARKRITELGLNQTVTLVEADGAHLPFEDESFDVVLVPYVMSVVPDPLSVGREMRRVCRTDGQIILVNHFLSQDSLGARLERWISPATRLIGFRTDLSLSWLLTGAGLTLIDVASVGIPPIWKLVTCVKG